MAFGLEKLGLTNLGRVFRNLSVPVLVEHAVMRGEGKLAANGALTVLTGKYTGRSPNDKFIVDESSLNGKVMWGEVNKPFPPDKFERLYNRLLAYLQGKDLYVFDGFIGADLKFRMPIRIINELAYQNLFSANMFIRPSNEELQGFEPEFTCICAPGFKAVPEIDGTNSEAFIIVSFERRIVIIGGTGYAGEIKKSMFSVMNFLLPKKDVLPMHCSCNIGKEGDVALFFGLSGTGKTTLSADPERFLVGDDEHGWSEDGVFNFEGGCYAKTYGLSKEREPEIFDAIRFGSLLENVVLDEESRVPDYNDASLTENARAAYPIEYIPNAVIPGIVGHPKTIIFLTADAYGVLPPISKLTKEQAMYQFLSGYTSK
ncbi:MAG TPA: phosphoenolpyruvate carboxykinase (ATP), partial [Bacillota bacterium]|nr:phosphoenolpyruvate carboxykinase (ATP) [Bacillota bacterium]